jgi:hypothetical protein
MSVGRAEPRRWIIVLLLCLASAVACSPPPPPKLPIGCLGTPGSDMTASVGQPVHIEATVGSGECAASSTEPQDDNLFKNAIAVGNAVRVRLLAPLLPVRIEAISSEVQSLRPERPEAVWEWQVVADKPGVHRLAIVVSVMDPGGEVVVENRQIDVRLHAEGTVGYYAGRAWDGLTAFVMNAQGLVAGIAAIASVLGGTWLARRRSRSRRASELAPDVVADRDRDPSGYL